MQINISGHHLDITDSIRESVTHKFSKVKNHYPHIDSLSVILTVERHEQKVEAQTQYLGAAVSVHASNEDLYAAISGSAKKLEAALAHRKGSVKSNLHSKPTIGDPAAVDLEE
ncbi:ribosome hibernation-promoting factor, HPF/YfiA family [Teredinibacter waterburyi]|jgi:SSU ribosomal protein S30P/sigma 54 modulation protein|uniref:ribosome hibernation-promoting factor, HPF/YfiA family n=1 Tax=Teredinibacter waterburyi TaxID=1500538 RepID=UPI00165FAEE7|nr:ribosome-associated translation inhibitor RaiA [Teredinibacter waterburyi]